MRKIKVIPRKFLFCPETGAEASFYGACPPGYEVRTKGWTWEVTRHDGSVTVGLCRVPAKTKEEALEIAVKAAERTGAWVEV